MTIKLRENLTKALYTYTRLFGWIFGSPSGGHSVEKEPCGFP
jgi:hypothetical protein